MSMMRVLAWHCLLALCTLASVSRAQDSACLNQLVPCLEYTNSKKTPSISCCNPLKYLIKSDPRCLCSMLGGNPSTWQAWVNMTVAQLLPARCGEKLNAGFCKSKHLSSSMSQHSDGDLIKNPL